jgi:glucuronokinase
MTIETHAYARAGFLGNPSDGYFGKIIAITVKDFQAKVSLQESHELMIQSQKEDIPIYKDMKELVKRINL